ncbi:MAG: OmpA family protein [Opitutales bacterium]
MHKKARIVVFILLSAVLFFSGCNSRQAPTPSGGGVTGSDVGQDLNIVPDSGLGDDFGLGAEGLELRDGAGFGTDGTYTDASGKTWKMVEGLFPSVYFGFDSSAISASERGKLQQAADYLQANQGTALLIEGHCDWYGTAEYNLALGDRRAESASNYLGTLGITPLRIDKLSKGSFEATSGLSKTESSQDRRADLILLQD